MNFELAAEEKYLQEVTRTFVNQEIRPLVSEMESKKIYPIEILCRMAKQGLFRLLVPKEYGWIDEVVRSLPICVLRKELSHGHNLAGASIGTQGLGSYPPILGTSQICERRISQVWPAENASQPLH